MTDKDVVERVISAWNEVDIESILADMTDDAVYYDAFWNESCKKENLTEYLTGCFEEEQYFYVLKGEIYRVGNNIAFYYEAQQTRPNRKPITLFIGSEIFTMRGDKISFMADYYCDTDPASLAWSAQLLSRETSKYARSGLRVEKVAMLKSELLTLMTGKQKFTDPGLTLPKLAKSLHCSVNHLSQVINSEFGSNFSHFLNGYRVNLAKELLLTETEDKHQILNIAESAGFASVSAFYSAFRRHSGQTPKQYQKQAQS